MRKLKKLKHPFLCKKLVEGGINDEKLILYNYLLSMQRKEYDLLLSKNNFYSMLIIETYALTKKEVSHVFYFHSRCRYRIGHPEFFADPFRFLQKFSGFSESAADSAPQHSDSDFIRASQGL